MKLFLKVVKFYFHLLKKIVMLIRNNKELVFLANFQTKLGEFLENRITYFVDLKKVTHELKIDDFYCYLDIINYW